MLKCPAGLSVHSFDSQKDAPFFSFLSGCSHCVYTHNGQKISKDNKTAPRSSRELFVRSFDPKGKCGEGVRKTGLVQHILAGQRGCAGIFGHNEHANFVFIIICIDVCTN